MKRRFGIIIINKGEIIEHEETYSTLNAAEKVVEAIMEKTKVNLRLSIITVYIKQK